MAGEQLATMGLSAAGAVLIAVLTVVAYDVVSDKFGPGFNGPLPALTETDDEYRSRQRPHRPTRPRHPYRRTGHP